MTTQAPTYSYPVRFPRTEIFTSFNSLNEIRISKKGDYTYKSDVSITVFPKNAMSGTDSMDRRHIDYSEQVGKTDIIKQADGELYAKYKRSWYPLDCFVCGYTAQPCIYV